MTQTLQYCLEQNQAQQQSLDEKFYRQRDRASQKAILWIEKREPETAAALVGKKADLVFQELCRVYDTQLWKLSENELFLNFRWFPEGEFLCLKNGSIGENILYIVAIGVYGIALLLIVASAISKLGLVAAKVSLISVPIGITLYLLSIIIRVILKVYVVRKNLVWYAPICSFYQFQNRNDAVFKQLREKEKRLKETLKNIDVWELERLKDDTKWFYERLNSAPPKNKKHRRL
jgi:hypothetical protein